MWLLQELDYWRLLLLLFVWAWSWHILMQTVLASVIRITSARSAYPVPETQPPPPGVSMYQTQ